MSMCDKILKKILIDPKTECWVWQGYIDPDGYARTEVSGGKNKFVHRLSYEAFVEKIGHSMTIDHICKNRKCCNPKHLQVLNIKENILSGGGFTAINSRKTHCKRGHIFDEANTYIRKDRVGRNCIKCRMINASNPSGKEPNKNIPVIDRIKKKLVDHNGCIIWIGCKNSDGYGKIIVNKKEEFVHKAFYREMIGEIPEGFGVYRKCGNKLCCALNHLHLLPLGTVSSELNFTLVK